MHGRQRKHADRLYFVFLQQLHRIGEPRFLIHIGNHEGPLILKHPAGHALFLYALVFQDWIGLVAMNRDVPLDGACRFIVLRDPDAVKFNDTAQFIDQHIEEFSRFAVGADRLGDADKRLVARHDRLLGRSEAQLGRSSFDHEGLDAKTWKLGSRYSWNYLLAPALGSDPSIAATANFNDSVLYLCGSRGAAAIVPHKPVRRAHAPGISLSRAPTFRHQNGRQ